MFVAGARLASRLEARHGRGRLALRLDLGERVLRGRGEVRLAHDVVAIEDRASYIGVAGAQLGYRYKDQLLALGPVKAGMIKPGKLAKLAAKGAGLAHFVGSRGFTAKNATVGVCP